MKKTVDHISCDRCLITAVVDTNHTPEGWVLIDAGAFMPDLCPTCYEAFVRWCNTPPATEQAGKDEP